MVTIGLGTVVRAAAVFLFQGLPAGLPFPLPRDPVTVQGVLLSMDELVAAGLALLCVAMVSWGMQHSRMGLAFRALADDQQAAMLVGIDLHRSVALTWALMGLLCVVAGTLWTWRAGGGVGVVLVGLKVLPIVIIGGLDSVPGTLLGALVVGLLESMAAGYLDPLVGGGFGSRAAYLVALVVLCMRPTGCLARRPSSVFWGGGQGVVSSQTTKRQRSRWRRGTAAAGRRHTMWGEAAQTVAWGEGGSPVSRPEATLHKACTTRHRYTSPYAVTPYRAPTALFSRPRFPPHSPGHLCYAGVAHEYGGQAPGREDMRWTLSQSGTR